MLREVPEPEDRGDMAFSILHDDIDIDGAVRASFVAILSRAFEDEEVDCCKLVPVLDMTQHDGTKFNINHNTNKVGDVVVTALRDLDQGEELLNDYHDEMEPHQFFTFYGFVPGERDGARKLLRSKSPIFFSGS